MLASFCLVIGKLLERQPIKYLLAGAGAFSIDYSSFLILYYVFNVPAYIAGGTSFMLGFIVSFIMQRFWVFGSKEKKTNFRFREAILYFLLAICNLFITASGIDLLTTYGLAPSIGKLILILLIMLWNFILYKYVIFKH